MAGMKDLNVIVKGDVQGSVEVIAEDLSHMSTEKVRVRVLHSGVGAITESDVLLASASNAIIIGFNVRPDRKSSEVAERENVEIRLHSDHLRAPRPRSKRRCTACSIPSSRKTTAGRAEVLNIFKITKVGQIAGCRMSPTVLSSAARRLASRAKASRSGRARSSALKRFKDDVGEVRDGVECGIDLAGHKDIRVADIIETYTTEQLDANLGQNSAELKRQQLAELKIAKDIENEAARAEATV